jgi:hypothetical protein
MPHYNTIGEPRQPAKFLLLPPRCIDLHHAHITDTPIDNILDAAIDIIAQLIVPISYNFDDIFRTSARTD